ncbi:hypothetical protein AB0I61_32675 [Polymorphospora rubra]|uniref:hypothetical protein n=1 Tax=Polymorphospora rubra TaxID=338584 RepID=UPI003409D190
MTTYVRKAPTVRIRLHGTPAEITATLAATLDIHTISRRYRDRPPSTLERIYLDASPRRTKESK